MSYFLSFVLSLLFFAFTETTSRLCLFSGSLINSKSFSYFIIQYILLHTVISMKDSDTIFKFSSTYHHCFLQPDKILRFKCFFRMFSSQNYILFQRLFHDKHQEHLIVSWFIPGSNRKRDFKCMEKSFEYVDIAM